MPRLAFLVASLVAFAGCEKLNPLYCSDEPHPSGPGCIADPDAQSEPDAPRGPCQVNNDCTGTPNTPVCDTKQSPHMCVQCTDEEHALCTGITPVCKNNSCAAACVSDDDCDTGGLCLPDGACAASASIIRAVANGGKNVRGCGVPEGPGACTLERALTEADDTKNVIKLDDNGPYTPGTNNNFVVNKNVTIDARGSDLGGAVLHPANATNNNPILTINSNKIVTIFGGKIEGPNNSDGIFCDQTATLTIDGTIIDTIDKSAINARNGCKLTVTHATISNTSQGGQFVASILAAGNNSVTLSRSTLFSNKGGGISVTNGTFVLVGNSFSNNGDTMSPVGGVLIATTTSDPMNRIEFNTIGSNRATSGGKAPGVDCTTGSGFIARNNIIWNNITGSGSTAGLQVGGTCQHAYSNIQMPIAGTVHDGESNQNIDPMFVAPIYDLHLQPTSPMIMQADPNANLDGVAAKDFDGDPRIAPGDIGFDQHPRP